MRLLLWLIFIIPAYATDLREFAVMSRCWEKPRCWECRQYDYSGNGVVDLVDLMILAERWCEDMSLPNQIMVSGITNPEALNGVYRLVNGVYLLDGTSARYFVGWDNDNSRWAIGDLVDAPTAFIGDNGDANTLPTSWTASEGYSGTVTVQEYTGVQSIASNRPNLNVLTRDYIITNKRSKRK